MASAAYRCAEKLKSEAALRHKHFPLVYYPRFFWASEVGPKYEHQNSGSWGIIETKYKTLQDKPFTASCSIAPVDPLRSDSRIEGEFAKHGDSKCQGSLLATKNDKALGALIYVWAVGAPQINHIYDAAVEQLQSFIQE